MRNDRELAALQEAMLEILHATEDPAAALALLRADPRTAAYRDWLATFEPRMVKLAGELVRKWGRQESVSPGGRQRG